METSIHRFRLAPTPSGFLHEGNGFNFIRTALRAHAVGGSLRLRIDDLDAPRVRPEYLEDVFETLAWLELQCDAGPQTVGEHQAHFSQQLRLPHYDSLLQDLADTGVVFACTCSRAEILAHSTDGSYPGTCRTKGLPLNTPEAAWRVAVPKEFWVSFEDRQLGLVRLNLAQEMGDFVVRRRDRLPAYHIASLCDDLAYGITDIIRGEDLLPSTAAQLHLARLLNRTAFAAVRFEHHALLKDETGEKRSKSAGAAALRTVRSRGAGPAAVYRRFSAWMGWNDVATSWAEVAARL